MALGYGIVTAAAQLGLDAILVKPKRGIGPFTAHVTVSERHSDDLEIVDHPVEAGSPISDHAFKRPPEVVIECIWSDSPPPRNVLDSLAGAVTGTIRGAQAIITGNSQDQVRDIYAKLVTLQESLILFDVFTGKRPYKDMLLKSLVVETDKETENILRVTAVLRHVFIVTVRVVTISAPADQQADPEATLPESAKGIKQLAAQASSFNLRSAINALTPNTADLILGASQ